MARALPPEERYWASIGRDENTPPECIDWLKSRDADGYGLFSLTHDTQIVASRYGLGLKLGVPLVAGEMALHTCDRPPCQEPSHLFLGTDATNMADMSSKGRGIAHGTPQFSEIPASKVAAIRARCLEEPRDTVIAREFNVSRSTVYLFRHNKRRRE